MASSEYSVADHPDVFSSGISWGAVIGGAFVAAAISLVSSLQEQLSIGQFSPLRQSLHGARARCSQTVTDLSRSTG